VVPYIQRDGVETYRLERSTRVKWSLSFDRVIVNRPTASGGP
jgi:hypothetical protein